MPRISKDGAFPQRLPCTLQTLVVPEAPQVSTLFDFLSPAELLMFRHGVPEPALEDFDYYVACLNKTFPTYSGDTLLAPEWYPSAPLAETLPDEVYGQCLPHISVKNPNLVAYWESPEKFKLHRETPIKVGKLLKSKTDLCESEIAAKVVRHKLFTGAEQLQVKFAANDDLEGWDRGYRTEAVKSCMNNEGSYSEAYNLNVHRNYASSAFGLQDNGLRLACLETSNQVVARAIVHEPTKTFVRCYGDDNLKPALLDLGYTEAEDYPEGLILYTEEVDDGYTAPYIDGGLYKAELGWDSEAGCNYFELSPYGDYELDTPMGLVKSGELCEVCWERSTDCRMGYYYDGCQTRELCMCESCLDSLYEAEDSCGDTVYARVENTVYAENSSGWSTRFTQEAAEEGYRNLNYSNLLGEWIYGDEVVRLHNGDYAFADSNGVEYLEYLDEYGLSSDSTWIPELGLAVLDSDTEEYELSDGSLTCVLPVRGLSKEIDELVDNYLKMKEESLQAETEVSA